MCPLAVIMAIQLNTLQVGYVSIAVIKWPFTEYIASGICVHLQIINIAIQLNTLQVG